MWVAFLYVTMPVPHRMKYQQTNKYSNESLSRLIESNRKTQILFNWIPLTNRIIRQWTVVEF